MTQSVSPITKHNRRFQYVTTCLQNTFLFFGNNIFDVMAVCLCLCLSLRPCLSLCLSANLSAILVCPSSDLASGLIFELKRCCPEDGEPCMTGAKFWETLVEARSADASKLEAVLVTPSFALFSCELRRVVKYMCGQFTKRCNTDPPSAYD